MYRVRNQLGCSVQLQRSCEDARPVTVAVLDTGIFLHPGLKGRVLGIFGFCSWPEPDL